MQEEFNKLKDGLLNLDPVYWTQKYLTLEGSDYRLIESGYRPIVEIMRYMAVKALEKDAKPMIWLKSRQIGGTITSAATCMYYMGSGLFGNENNPPIRICYLWPQLDRAANFSKTKLASFIDASVQVENPNDKKGKTAFMKMKLDKSSAANDNQRFKQFQGGNHIWIESAGTDANRIRGLTCDVLICDEVQEYPVAAISNATKVLTKAQYGPPLQGVQIYFGTPLQRGSHFWQMWNKSSQQFFYLGCESCKDYFPLYTPGSNEWENIWLYGNVVRCTHCGREQDRRDGIARGKWVASKNSEDCQFVGFHLNQLYLPEQTKETIMSQKPGISAINTERAYQNEVLGEFFQGEAGIISPEEIMNTCGDHERKFRNSITAEDDTVVFMGIDIGAKSDLAQFATSDKVQAQQGQSYSVAVVLAAKGGNLSIEYACKFKKNDIEAKKSIVSELMKRFTVKLSICDIGYANDFNELMQVEYGERWLSSQAGGKVLGNVKYNSDIFPKTIFFDREFYITEMYEQLRKGKIRFPLGSYEQVYWLMQHCSNMEIKPTITRSGEINPHYVKAGPTDGFMALINAYLAYKYYISNGFTIAHPLLQKEEKVKPKASLITVNMARF